MVNHTRELHGSEQVMIHTLRQCRAQGWRVTMVLPLNQPEGGLEQAVAGEADIVYFRYKCTGEGLLRALAIELYNLPARIRFIRWLRMNKVDAIYSNTTVTLLGVEAARCTRIPHVWHWHELPTSEFGWSAGSIRLLRYWARFSSQILFISRTQQQMWEQAFRHSIDHARVVYNPVKTIHTIRTESPGAVRIGYVGSFTARKNLPWLIQTVAQLAKEYDVRLFLYGAKDRHEAESVQAQWKEMLVLSVHEHTEDVASVYARMDILVLPSWSETMPLTVLEAMQAGVCVIQTNRSGMTELMEDGKECLFISPDETESLRQALIRCMDASYRTEIATRGQLFAQQWMAQNDYPRAIKTVFNHLLNED